MAERGGGADGDSGQHLPLHRYVNIVEAIVSVEVSTTETSTTAARPKLQRPHRPVDPAQGGQAARAGTGRFLRRRLYGTGWGIRPLRPLAVRSREDRLHRRRGRARAGRRLRDVDGRRGRDQDRTLLRDVDAAGQRDQGLRARGRPRALHGRAGRCRLCAHARARPRRPPARRGRVRTAAGARGRARAVKNETVMHDAGSNVVSTASSTGATGRTKAEADHIVKIDELHFHRFSSTPLEVLGRSRRVRAGGRPVDAPATTRCPASARSGWRLPSPGSTSSATVAPRHRRQLPGT